MCHTPQALASIDPCHSTLDGGAPRTFAAAGVQPRQRHGGAPPRPLPLTVARPLDPLAPLSLTVDKCLQALDRLGRDARMDGLDAASRMGYRPLGIESSTP